MAARKCSDCKKASRDGFMSTYAAWYPEPDKRVAYRTLHCSPCSIGFAGDIKQHRGNLADAPDGDTVECQRCGGTTDGVWCVTYLTIFMPHTERLDVELWNCETCAIGFRSYLQGAGERLPERAPASAALPGPESPWAALGLA